MVRREYLVVLFCISQFLTITAGLSCRAGLNASSTNGNSVVKTEDSRTLPNANDSSSSLSPTPERQLSGIRQVNFRDFTYPWYPSFLKSPHYSREVTLRDGKFEVGEDQTKGIRYLTLELDDVSYENLRGGGREQALVYIRGISVTNRFVGCLFVYDFANGSLRLLWQYETGDRADGGLRKMEVKDQRLIIEQNTLEGGAGLCCPKKFVRRYFKWNGKEFRNIKSEVLHDEQKN